MWKLFFKKAKKNEVKEEPVVQQRQESKLIVKTPYGLKTEGAQVLMNKGFIIIEGERINLWTGYSRDSVANQTTWNHIGSYSDLNKSVERMKGIVVLTGVMQIPRVEVAELSTGCGYFVRSTVSKKTNYLVVGTENVSPSKVAKVNQLNDLGADIKVITENTFLELISENIRNFS